VRESLGQPQSSVATETPSPVEGDEWIPNASWDSASTEWLEREARMAAKKERRFDVPVPRLRTFISLGIFLVVALPVLIGIFDGKEAIQEAGVGDCFVSAGAIEIDQVAILDCSEAHDTEVFAVVDATSLGSSYPGEDPLFDWLFDECHAQFSAYTGESYQTSRYWIDAFIPTDDAWRLGDHEGLCTLVVLDDDMDMQMTTGSGRRTANA
ncbi:MAG: septum formation family protein, partial [Acidimicrobiia bacterium]